MQSFKFLLSSNATHNTSFSKAFIDIHINHTQKEHSTIHHSRCLIKPFLTIAFALFGIYANTSSLYANMLESEFNSLGKPKIPSQINTSTESIVNAKEVQVHEKNGILESNELEVIDLYGKSKTEEKIDYAHCAAYYRQTSLHLGKGLYAIKLKSGEIIGYSPVRPRLKNLVKYDPFTGLFQVSGRVDSRYAYELSDIDDYALSRELASVGINGAKPGRFQTHQAGFLQYAEFSTPTQKNGVISNICYRIYGLSVGGNGFIEKSYIDRFLAQKQPYYGDIGVRFDVSSAENATFVVQFSDPFFPSNPFKRGDVLISINDVAPKDWGELELIIANLEPDELVQVKIKRGENIKNIKVKAKKRYGGMLLADSFLERFNLVISNDLVVQKAPSKGPFSKLKKGDRILFINDIDMRHFKPRNTTERNHLLRELFTRIQDDQVDFLEQKIIHEAEKEATKRRNADILEQFQSKEVKKERHNDFYYKMADNMRSFASSDVAVGTNITNNQTSKRGDLHSFSGDGILRDSDTQSMRTIYDIYDSGNKRVKKPEKERIKEYEALVEYGGQMNFLIDRQGFQFRVPLE